MQPDSKIEATMKTVKHGIFLVPPHGEMIWSGNKIAIVKAYWHDVYHKGFCFLCAGKYCYGMIRFKKPKKITDEKFDELKGEHKITGQERNAWWPKASSLFYAQVRNFLKFDKPRPVNLPQSVQDMIKYVKECFDAIEADPEITPSVCLELPTPREAEDHLLSLDGQDLVAYSIAGNNSVVRNLEIDYASQLLFNHAVIHEVAESALLESGKIPLETITRHSAIASEIESRGMEHFNETVLDSDSPSLDEHPLLKIEVLGTRGDVEEWSPEHKKFTGILLTAHDKKILLDCGDESYLEKDPALVLLSHFHPDHFAWHTLKPEETEEECEDFSEGEDLQHAPIRTYGSTIYRHIMKFEHPECEVYVEPFCGSCSVLFSREPVKTEVVNDLNSDTIFALRFIKSLTKSELARLKKHNWIPNINTWKRNRDQWKAKKFKDKVHRFYLYKYLSLYSFHWSGSEPAGSRVETESRYNPDKLWRAKERLQGVKIYKNDYKEIIRMYDSPKTFMFIDPPYRRHIKSAYADEGLDWDAYYKILSKLKCKFIALNSDGKEDKAAYSRLKLKFHVTTFPGSSSYRVSSPRAKKKFMCGANFPLLKCKDKKSKPKPTPFKGSRNDDFDESGQELPEELFVAHPFSKCDISNKAERAGIDVGWEETYELGAFKFRGYPVDHSKACPAVAWKVKVADKTILFMPDVLKFDPKILEGVNIYIGDGTSFTHTIKRKGNVGHLSVHEQIQIAKENGVDEIYFIHCGKEVIENPELEEPDIKKEIEKLGARVLKDGEIIKKVIQLIKPIDNKMDDLPVKEIIYGRSVEDFDKQTLVEFVSEISTLLSLEIEDFVEVTKEPPMPESAETLIKKWSGISRKKLTATDPRKLPKNFYVMQNHYRGESSHADLLIKTNGSLDGETLLNQVPGVIKEPVTTIEQAAMWSRRYHSDEASQYTKCYPGMPPHKGFMVLDKESYPITRATAVSSIIEPGQAGATKEFPGVLYGEDWGIAYRTVIKPWFVETWLFGKWFRGARLIERLLSVTRKTERVGEKKVFWRGHISDPKLPPYIFSPSFFKNTEWVPEDSALPPQWESIVPPNLRWWGKGLPKKQRLDLIKATFNFLVEEKFLKGEKKVLDESDFSIMLKTEKWPYTLHRVWWRGPAHVRYLPVSVWRLRLKHKNGGLLTFEFETDPTRNSIKGFASLRNVSKTKPLSGGKPEDWLSFSGSIPVKHPENPNKKLEARVVIEDSGDFRPVSSTNDFLSGTFSGEKLGLRGYYTIERESPESDFWLFKKSAGG